MSERKREVVVVGAGIVGVSTALWLQRDGHKVTLVDRAGPGEGASYGNGGVLASGSIIPVTVPGLIPKIPRMLFGPDQPLFLKWSYLPRLLPWLVPYLRRANLRDMRHTAEALAPIVGDSLADHQALSAGTPAERYVRPCEYVFLYPSREPFERDEALWTLRSELGFRWTEMDGDAFRVRDPIFSEEVGFVVRNLDHGRITDPGAYVRALAARVEACGGRIVKAEVTDFVRKDGRIAGVRAGGETLPCDAAVLAAGAWSGSLAFKLGLRVPLESERGYHLEFWEPSAMPCDPVMLASGKFVLTPMDGRLRAAGLVEFGGLDAPASRAPFAFLERTVRRAIPGLSWRRKTEWMGHRPAPADSVPVIGEVPGAAGAYTGFGHHHVGLTGGPKTGRVLAQLIAGKRPNLDLSVYSPARYARDGR